MKMNITKEQALSRIVEFEDDDKFVPMNNIDLVKSVRKWTNDKKSEDIKHKKPAKDTVGA